MRVPSVPYLATALCLALAAGGALQAEPVTALQAQAAARAWLQRTPAPMGTSLGVEVAEVVTHGDAAGKQLFHEVRLAGGGFVILAADDRIDPVVALCEGEALDGGPESHLDLLLRKDMKARLARVESFGKGPGLPEDLNRAEGRWRDLLFPTTIDSHVATVSDMRVAPLVKSFWNQATANAQLTYNYYTPNNYVCGCVATAMAQLMRFHQWPTAGIGAKTFRVKVDGVAQNLVTRGGDGAGGAYVWSSMPLSPSASTTTAERQMIGSLTYDAGLAVNMSYAADGSGASSQTAAAQLKATFKYANVVFGFTGGELTGDGLEAMVLPNLDAGLPVMLGITGAAGGHSIVCDGYGYTGATRYYHLNMGWGGSSNAWYALPGIDSSPSFNLIDECIYNVFPAGSGEILSGRITDAAGNPVPGVTVTDGTLSATTGDTGIYALKGAATGIKTITATKSGATYPSAVRIMNASVDTGDPGNIYGVDLVQNGGATPLITPAPASTEVKLGGSATFSAGATGQGPLHFAWTKNGSAIGTDSPTCTLTGATLADDQASIGLRVTGSQGTADAAPATLSVVRLFNGTFEYGQSGWNLWSDGVVLGAGYYSEVDPHAGKSWLCIGDWASSCTDFAMQDVELPATGSLGLSFWMGIRNASAAPATAANLFKVKVLSTTGTTLATLMGADNTAAEVANGKAVWKAYGPYDLTPWKGQTIRLRLESYQPGGDKTGTVFAIDDLALLVTQGPRAAMTATPLTLATGAQAPFTATVTGQASDNRVDWSVTGAGGTFNPARTAGDGSATTTFTAGATPGAYTVTATPVETGTAATRPVTLVDPATVTVGLVPSATLVNLSQAVTLTASVGSLTDGSVTWTCNGGAFTAQGGTTATWSSAAAGSYTLTATSNGAPTRAASVQVTVVDLGAVSLALTPASAILRPGGTCLFTCSGDMGLGVDWHLTTGAGHADTGLSTTVTVPATVPLATATYTLTATHKVATTRTATATITVKGVDLNGDGAADPRDLLTLAAEWGKGAASPANFKGSGTVDDTDLGTLLDQIK